MNEITTKIIAEIISELLAKEIKIQAIETLLLEKNIIFTNELQETKRNLFKNEDFLKSQLSKISSFPEEQINNIVNSLLKK